MTDSSTGSIIGFFLWNRIGYLLTLIVLWQGGCGEILLMITSVSQVYILRSRVTAVIMISIPISAHRNTHSEFLLAIFFSVFGTSAGILWGAARILSIILNTRSAATYNEKWNFELGYFPHFSYIFITFCVPTNLFYCTSETFIIYCGIKPTKSQNRKGAINCDVDTGAKLRIPATLQIPWGK